MIIMLRYIEGWNATPVWEIPDNFLPKTKVSILISARNEAENIQACLHAVLNQNYPAHLFEVILIDDHSTDETHQLAESIGHENLKILRLEDFVKKEKSLKSYKKKAIEIGIKNSLGNLIVATDADCIVPENWLKLIVSFFEKKELKFIAAPVNFYQEKTLFEKFQSLDFLGMMGVTSAGIHRRFMRMCNGANLAYEKKAFFEVGGFEGINHLASGDDMLLMQKMTKRFPAQVGFLKNKNATVFTKTKSTVNEFTQQRIRWASKSSSYPEPQIIITLGFVFLFCINILLSFVALPWFFENLIWVFLIQILVKAIIDYFFLKKMCTFFQRKDLMKIFIPAQIIHIIYIVAIGILSNLKKEYNWKGRKVS